MALPMFFAFLFFLLSVFVALFCPSREMEFDTTVRVPQFCMNFNRRLPLGVCVCVPPRVEEMLLLAT